MSFLGPEPTQGPMNNVFEQKNSWEKKFFWDPRDPRPKKISSPARAGPAGPTGSPKVVQIVPLGSLTLLKRSGILKNINFEYKYYVELFCLAKVMPKTRFLATVEGFWPVLGPAGANPRPVDCKPPKNTKFKNLLVVRVLTQIFFRLLKHPKRLGLGQKVPGKHPFGPIEPQFRGPKNTGARKDQMGQKWHFCKNCFSRFGHKTGKTGQFLYCRVYLVSQKHSKDIGKG